jgi:threonine 3-dehydrogenase
MGAMVTGATGFIGAALVRLLLENGEKNVVAFHRNPAKKTLDDVADRVNLVQGDLGVFSNVLDVVKEYRPTVIYHLGAMLTLPSDANPPAAFQANVAGTFHVLEAARLFDVGQVLFASSIGSYGLDLQGEVIDDHTIQRPLSMYGVSKVFGENLGRYHKLRYGLDFRCLRYPGILGPGFRTPSLAQYASRLIEESVRGRPVILDAPPDAKFPLLYYKDAAQAMIELAQAPAADIRMVNYLLNGVTPLRTNQELADLVKDRVPEARVTFEPDPELTQIYQSRRPLDDRCAREEWGWQPKYDFERLIDDFIAELRQHPERYA